MSKAYEQSGVNIHAGYEAVERISSHVERTMRKEVLGGLGGFGATFDLSQLNISTRTRFWYRWCRYEIKTCY